MTESNLGLQKHTFASEAKIEIVNSIEAFHKLASSWRKLELETLPQCTVFQSFDWVNAWCQAYLDSSNETTMLILTGHDQDELVFVLPLAKSRRHGITILDWMTDPIGQYGDVLCANGQNAEMWLELAFKTISSLPDIDLVRLRHVRATSTVNSFAVKFLQDANCDERAPFLDLTLFKSEAEYDARYTPAQRKRRKKIRKGIEDIGSFEFAILKTGDEINSAVDLAISEKNAWLSDRGRFNRVMGCQRHINFLKNLSHIQSPTFSMKISAITAGGKPISWEIGFRYRETHFAYITSHVNALTDLSPGRLHMDLSQRSALADGQKAFDLMVPYDLHKESWCSGMIATKDYFKAISWRGSLYGTLYLQNVRPVIRKIYYKLSPRALRLLQRVTHH